MSFSDPAHFEKASHSRSDAKLSPWFAIPKAAHDAICAHSIRHERAPLNALFGALSRAENDNWASALATSFSSVGAFALDSGSRDAALVVILPAGKTYTVQVSSADGVPGEALVEVYEIKP